MARNNNVDRFATNLKDGLPILQMIDKMFVMNQK